MLASLLTFPHEVTYNEMLNALVQTKDRKGMWNLVTESARAPSCILRLKVSRCRKHATFGC